jgi:hypothetical protein
MTGRCLAGLHNRIVASPSDLPAKRLAENYCLANQSDLAESLNGFSASGRRNSLVSAFQWQTEPLGDMPPSPVERHTGCSGVITNLLSPKKH